jgi:hypothetical protein
MISITPGQDFAASVAVCLFIVAGVLGLGAWDRRATRKFYKKCEQKPPEPWT